MNNTDKEHEQYEMLSEQLKLMIQSSYHDSQKAQNLIFKESNYHKIGALAYLNKAISNMSSAKVLYYSHFYILGRNEIEDIFNAFETFASEMIQNYSTNPKHRWTANNFNSFKAELQASIFAISGI